MGGTVSLSVAVRYPERVKQVVVIGSPVVGSSLAFMLKLAGMRPVAWVVYNAMWALKLGLRLASPVITSDRRWPDMLDQDLSKMTLESFLTSIASLRKTDLRPVLGAVTAPVMGMYGDRDVIVHPRQWQPLLAGAGQTRVERFHKAGHFIMLDEPVRFMQVLKDFLDQANGAH
jgi:pimeloyl-ACP methyl ester carboxylesterase